MTFIDISTFGSGAIIAHMFYLWKDKNAKDYYTNPFQEIIIRESRDNMTYTQVEVRLKRSDRRAT
jgi:hypothetical protein